MFKWLFGRRKKIDLGKVRVSQVAEVAPEALDMRTTINLLQHLVNTIIRISDESGNVVGKWSMLDILDIMGCFDRMSKQEGGK